MCDCDFRPKARITDPTHPQYVAPDPNKRVPLDPNKSKESGIPDHLGYREKRMEDPDVIEEMVKKMNKY